MRDTPKEVGEPMNRKLIRPDLTEVKEQLHTSAKPYRLHIRGPSFVNLQTLPTMMRGGLIADAVAVISSVDPVMGEVDR